MLNNKTLKIMPFTGTFNQQVQFDGRIGGYRRVFEGQVKLLVGGFQYDLNDLPLPGFVLPAGTPVYCDEQARTIVPLRTFKVVAVANGKVHVEKFNAGTRVKVGESLIVVPDDFANAAKAAMEVSAIDNSNSGYDILTVDSIPEGIVAGTILCIGNADKTARCVPNALSPYDICLSKEAVACDGEGAWNCMDFPVLERRMPPITDSIKKALADAGCFFRWSNRK